MSKKKSREQYLAGPFTHDCEQEQNSLLGTSVVECEVALESDNNNFRITKMNDMSQVHDGRCAQ